MVNDLIVIYEPSRLDGEMRDAYLDRFRRRRMGADLTAGLTSAARLASAKPPRLRGSVGLRKEGGAELTEKVKKLTFAPWEGAAFPGRESVQPVASQAGTGVVQGTRDVGSPEIRRAACARRDLDRPVVGGHRVAG
jgi:hypothetical protein